MNSKRSVILTDMILIAGLVLCLVSNKKINPGAVWQSFHCVACAAWFALMLLHVWQHRKLVKALRQSKVRRRNRLTTLTMVVFIAMFVSIAALIAMTTPGVVRFHVVLVHIFMAVVIVHLIAKGKRLFAMVRAAIISGR